MTLGRSLGLVEAQLLHLQNGINCAYCGLQRCQTYSRSSKTYSVNAEPAEGVYKGHKGRKPAIMECQALSQLWQVGVIRATLPWAESWVNGEFDSLCPRHHVSLPSVAPLPPSFLTSKRTARGGSNISVSHSSWSPHHCSGVIDHWFGHVSEDLSPGEESQASTQQITDTFRSPRGDLQWLKRDQVPSLFCLCPCLILSINALGVGGSGDTALPTACRKSHH